MPTLKALDYSKVKPAEREKAARFASSAAGAALESDLQLEQHSIGDNGQTKTFTPGELLPDEITPYVSTTFTAEQKQQIRELLENASSVKEVEEIENAVARGILPDKLKKKLDMPTGPDTKRQKI